MDEIKAKKAEPEAGKEKPNAKELTLGNQKTKPTVKAGWVLMQHAKSGAYRQCLPANVRGFERAGFVVAD